MVKTANPIELIKYAAENRKRRNQPTPSPKTEKITAENMRMIPNGHSAYSALMRKHDRLHPRIGG